MLGENIGTGFQPSTFTIDIKGGKELFDILNTLPDKLARSVERGPIKEAGQLVLDKAKRDCPVWEGLMRPSGMKLMGLTKAIPGALRASLRLLHCRPKKNRIAYIVGTSQGWFTGPEYYGGFVEFGTWKWPGKPFVRPAFDSQQDKIIQKIITGINTALMKIWMGRSSWENEEAVKVTWNKYGE